MTILSKIVLAAAIGCVVTGCSQVPVVYTITSESHIRASDKELAGSQKPDQPKPTFRFVVWGNHQGATNAVIETLQQSGERVVERARLQAIFDEQKISLTHSSDDDVNLLRVGKLAGADRVIFIEAGEKPEAFTPSPSTAQRIGMGMEGFGAGLQGRDPLWMRMPRPNPVTVYRPSVTVRAVTIDTGEIIWSGSSTTSQPINDPEVALVILTRAAMLRAMCPIERGAEWVEYASDGSRQPWGCQEKQSR